MFDSKIIIYVKFQVYKRWKKNWGQLFSPLFSSPCRNSWPVLPHITPEMAPNLGSTEEFQKSQQCDCSSAMGLGGSEKKLQFRVKTMVPHQKTLKKVMFCLIWTVFQRFCLGTVVLNLNWSFSEPHRSIAEIHLCHWDFWNSSVGPRFGGVSVGFGGTTGPNSGGKIPKRGLKFCPSKILILF